MINFKNHFLEIKNRCIIFILSWLLMFITSYYNKELIIYIILKPIINIQFNFFYFIFTNVTEIFFTYINFTLFISNHCFLFLGYYQIINFLLPGLYSYESNKLKTTYYYLILWWVGFSYCWYKFFISISWKFFFNFQNSCYKITDILFNFELKFNEYISFFIKVYIINITASHFFAIILVVIENIKKKTFFFIKHSRKSFFLIILLISTLISTPELFNQILLGIYYSFFFELTIFFIFIKNKNLILN